MNSIFSKFLVLALGVNVGMMTIEAISPHQAIAQQFCRSYRVTRADGLYVYINAGSQIITTLPYGHVVGVTGMSADREWARIEYLRVDGRFGGGWVKSDFLTCYQR